MKNKILVIGLGNSILSDDAIGLHVAEQVRLRGPAGVEVVQSETAGYALLELMTGYERVILVDAIMFRDVEPATIVRIEPTDLRTSLRIRSVHEIDLMAVLTLGRALEIPMPSEVVVFGIQAADARTFSMTLTPALEAVVPIAATTILAEIERLQSEGDEAA